MKDITVRPISVNPQECINYSYVWEFHFHSSSGVEYFPPLLHLPPILFFISHHLTVYIVVELNVIDLLISKPVY
jgi:hypothetical protein